MAWPAAYGGGGRPQAYQDVVNAEMARQKVPFVPNTIGLNWAGPLILAIGSEAQKQRYIRGMLNADDIWCQGFSEPDQGSDLANCQTRAARDGDEYVINGAKIWTSLGQYAKYMILLARTDPAAKRYAGLSYFLIPMRAPGISTVPIRKLTGETGFTQTFFDNARVPADGLMGREGEGWAIAMQTLTFERGAAGGQAGGLARMALGVEDVVELARRSRRDGRAGDRRPVRSRPAGALHHRGAGRPAVRGARRHRGVVQRAARGDRAVEQAAHHRTCAPSAAICDRSARRQRRTLGRRCRRGRRRQMAARLFQCFFSHHRRRAQPDPGQHRRRACAGVAEGLSTRRSACGRSMSAAVTTQI